MNKLFTKIAALALGMTMATGVGVAVASSAKAAEPVSATDTNVSFTKGSNAASIKVNYNSAGAPASNNGVRLGTSKNAGTATFTIPSGTTTFGFYAVGWKDKSVTATLTASVGTLGSSSVSLTANSAATGTISDNATVAITGTDANCKKEISISSVTAASTITISANSSEKRLIAWDAYYVNADKTLSSISVNTAPTKTAYIAGEYFDPTGLVINRTWSSGDPDTLAYAGHTSDFDFSPTTSTALTTSHTSVTITHGGKSTTQAITVTAQKTPASVSSAGQTTTFDSGDTFTYGGTLTATYTDSTSSTVTPDSFKIGDAEINPISAGTVITPGSTALSRDDHNGKTVYVLYTENNTTVYTSYVITVNAINFVTLTAGTDVGTSSGNNSPDTLTKSGITMYGDDAAFATAEYRYYASSTLTFTSTVGNMTKIEFTGDSSKKMANISLSSGGGTVSTSGNDATWTGATGGTSTVSFSFSAQNRATLVKIHLAGEKTLVSVAVSGSMTKTTYATSESWDPTGLVVTGTYDDESTDDTLASVATFTYYNTSDVEKATPGALGIGTNQTIKVIATVDSISSPTKYVASDSITVYQPSYDNTTNLTPGDYYIKYIDSGTAHYITSVSSGKGQTSTSKTNAIVFTFNLVGDDSWEIRSGSDYLGVGGSSTSLTLDSTQSQLSILWETEASGTRIIRGSSGRDLAWYSSGSDIRTYSDKTDGTNGMTLESVKTVSGFSVYSTGANKNVLKGSTFDAVAAAAAGFQARLNYTDSTYDDVTSSATWTLDTATAGTKTLTVSYLTYTDTSVNDMNVYVAVIKTLSVDASSAKTSYVEGEQLNTADLVITGYEQDSTAHVIAISDCTFSPANGATLSTSDSSVTVTFTNEDTTTASTSYSITVSAFVGYTKVTSASDLVVGESYVLGVENQNHPGDLMGSAKDETATAFRNKVDASAAFNGSYTTVTQSGAASAGAVVVTLLSDGAGKFAFYSITDDKYLAGTQSGGYFINKTSLSDAGDDAWWTISFADNLMSVTLNGSTRVLGYNLGSPRFATYANYAASSTTATNGTAHPVLFKMTGSSVKTAVTSFANNSLKMNDPAYEGDITTPNCASNYAAMKTAYVLLSDAEKNVFQYSDDYAAARARMIKWAIANGETFTYGNSTPFATSRNITVLDSIQSNNAIAIIIIVSVISVSAIGGYFFLRKKREN